MKHPGVMAALLLWAAGSAACGRDGKGEPARAATQSIGPACAGDRPPELSLTGEEVRGVLRGTSRNGSTGCTRQRGTGGPEAMYLLRLAERALVDVEVTSNLDTVLAVRRVCDDPLTELACNDAPAGPESMTPASRDAHLRVVLDAGEHFLLLDEVAPFGVGGDYVIRARAAPAPAQSSCGSALPVQDGTSLLGEELLLGAEPAPPCGGGERRPTLYYSVAVPAGQRLTALASPLMPGERTWFPTLRLLGGCGQDVCLATDRDGQETYLRQLRYVNDGPTERRVVLAVSSSNELNGRRFRLDVAIDEVSNNGTCSTARPLSDGLLLRNQDLSAGQLASDGACDSGAGPSLFYSATLLPDQELRLMAIEKIGSGRVPLIIGLRESCGGAECRVERRDRLEYRNPGRAPRTVIVQISPFPGVSLAPFDLQVSMVGPPGRILLAPTGGLQTSEAGGTATFTIALNGPPPQPVVIPIESSDPAEGVVSPAEVRFDRATWQTPRTITVTGVDDSRRDGARPYEVRVGPAVSDDIGWTGTPGDPVSVVNRDDEPGFTVVAREPLSTTEAGAQATFTVVLDRAPTAAVRLALASTDPGEGNVSPAEVVFEPQGWDQPRTVTVTGVDDLENDGTQRYRILIAAATSADPEYAGLDPDDLEARNGVDEIERVAAQVVSGGRSCVAAGPLGPRLAVDAHGNLFAALPCLPEPGQPWPFAPGGVVPPRDGARPTPGPGPIGPTAGALLVASSHDGGQTFDPPVDTGQIAYEVQVATAGPGVVVLAVSGTRGLVIVRSDDAGVSWQPPRPLAGGGDNLRLAAAGNRVVASIEGRQGPMLYVSEDAGQTFQEIPAPDGRPVLGVALDSPTGPLWIVNADDAAIYRQSHDGGATFDAGISIAEAIPQEFAVGPRAIFASGRGTPLLVVPRDGAPRRSVAGLLLGRLFPRALVADAQDNLTLLESDDGTLQARRLPSGADTFLPARPLGTTQTSPAAVAISPNALALTLFNDGNVLVTIETWP
jgi:hypothetical protein